MIKKYKLVNKHTSLKAAEGNYSTNIYAPEARQKEENEKFYAYLPLWYRGFQWNGWKLMESKIYQCIWKTCSK